MPKLKTNKGAAKRLKLTKTGRIKRGSPGRRHMMKSKDAKRRRRLRKSKLVRLATIGASFSGSTTAQVHLG